MKKMAAILTMALMIGLCGTTVSAGHHHMQKNPCNGGICNSQNMNPCKPGPNCPNGYVDEDQDGICDNQSYCIRYKLNGGINNKKNPTTYYSTNKSIKLKKPTREGYTFKGWYSDKNFKNKIKKIKKGSSGKMTFYAKWKKI